jgi:hypothetical protein
MRMEGGVVKRYSRTYASMAEAGSSRRRPKGYSTRDEETAVSVRLCGLPVVAGPVVANGALTTTFRITLPG